MPSSLADRAPDLNALNSVGYLSDEICRFWYPQLKRNAWPARWRLINELCEQIGDDLPDSGMAAQLSGRVIADLITQLEDDPIRCEAQALTYRLSMDEAHIGAANDWLAGGAQPTGSGDERRRSPRHLVNREAAVWKDGRKMPAVLVDVSDTGALLECRAKVSIGDIVELKAGWAQTKRAKVIRGHDHFFGVQFS